MNTSTIKAKRTYLLSDALPVSSRTRETKKVNDAEDGVWISLLFWHLCGATRLRRHHREAARQKQDHGGQCGYLYRVRGAWDKRLNFSARPSSSLVFRCKLMFLGEHHMHSFSRRNSNILISLSLSFSLFLEWSTFQRD